MTAHPDFRVGFFSRQVNKLTSKQVDKYTSRRVNEIIVFEMMTCRGMNYELIPKFIYDVFGFSLIYLYLCPHG